MLTKTALLIAAVVAISVATWYETHRPTLVVDARQALREAQAEAEGQRRAAEETAQREDEEAAMRFTIGVMKNLDPDIERKLRGGKEAWEDFARTGDLKALDAGMKKAGLHSAAETKPTDPFMKPEAIYGSAQSQAWLRVICKDDPASKVNDGCKYLNKP